MPQHDPSFIFEPPKACTFKEVGKQKLWVVKNFQAEHGSWAIKNKATVMVLSLKSGRATSFFTQCLKSAAFNQFLNNQYL